MHLRKRMTGSLLMIFFAISARAEMPKELKGSWEIGTEASETHMKTSPKWKTEDAKYLPMIMKRMARVGYVFEDDAVVVTMGDKRQALPVTLKQSKAKTWVFNGQAGEQPVILTVTLNEQGLMNIKSSATDDMDYYLWQRKKKAE